MDDKDFQNDLEGIWKQMKPIHEKLRGYARYMFREYWRKDRFGDRDPHPAHIFGNMWAQTCENTNSILLPFNDASNKTVLGEVNTDLTEQLKTGKIILN